MSLARQGRLPLNSVPRRVKCSAGDERRWDLVAADGRGGPGVIRGFRELLYGGSVREDWAARLHVDP